MWEFLLRELHLHVLLRPDLWQLGIESSCCFCGLLIKLSDLWLLSFLDTFIIVDLFDSALAYLFVVAVDRVVLVTLQVLHVLGSKYVLIIVHLWVSLPFANRTLGGLTNSWLCGGCLSHSGQLAIECVDLFEIPEQLILGSLQLRLLHLLDGVPLMRIDLGHLLDGMLIHGIDGILRVLLPCFLLLVVSVEALIPPLDDLLPREPLHFEVRPFYVTLGLFEIYFQSLLGAFDQLDAVFWTSVVDLVHEIDDGHELRRLDVYLEAQ